MNVSYEMMPQSRSLYIVNGITVLMTNGTLLDVRLATALSKKKKKKT